MTGIERYPNLFKPLILGNVYFRNRIFSAPTGLLDLDNHLSPSFDHIAYFERKAKGGCASVNIGECAVLDYDPGESRYDLVRMKDHVHNYNGLGKLTDAINRNGAVAVAELEHFGAASLKQGLQQLAPSDGRNPLNPDIQMREMTEEQIQAVIEEFVSAAVYAKDRGFKMVQLHAGHGWLLNEFFSPFFNKRTDRWGGSAENRARITVTIVDEIHRRCGKGFPVEVRISGSEIFEGGYDINGGIEFAKQLDGHADLIHISAGNPYSTSVEYTHPDIFKDPGCNVWMAAEIKKHVKTPVATVGALSDPEMLEEIIASGKADVVELARGLICDPDLPNKLRTGRDKEVRRCLRCFTCVGEMNKHGRLFCAINPESGKEREILSHHDVPFKKHVLVAGGGIAGMEAAITAAKNGHKVTLCEKSDDLGGVLRCEVKVPFKTRIGEYIEHQKYMIEKAGIEVRLNTPVTPELVDELKPEAIIMAIGGEPIRPAIPGIDGKNVIGVEEAFADPDLARGKIVVVGAGRSGTELGIFFKNLGKDVSIIEALDKVPEQGRYMGEIKKSGLETSFGMKVKAIKADGIVCESAEGDKFVPADTVVLAIGIKPLWDEVTALSSFAGEFYQAGDCREARTILNASGEGWTMANLVGRY